MKKNSVIGILFKNTFFLAIIFLILPFTAIAEISSLPKCQGDDYRKWDNCFGFFKFPRGSYEGEWKDGNLDGKGKLIEAWGDIYQGDFKDNKANGVGTYIMEDGNSYEGEWKNDLYEGKGIFIYKNGDKIEGNFKKHLTNGKAILTYANGSVYKGEFKDDLYHGKGIHTYAEDVDVIRYEGNFKDNLRSGKGILTYINGNVYNGELKNNWEHGVGTMNYKNDKDGWLKYSGEWKDAFENGKGELDFTNGDKYIGEFKDSRFHGNGIFIFSEGDKYEGEWIDGYRQGKGQYEYKSGSVYRGEFKKNEAEGSGELTYADGSIYTGQFKKGFMNGKGTLVYKNNENGRLKYIGEFKDDWEDGQGTMYYTNGETYTGKFKDGNELNKISTVVKLSTDEKYHALIIGNNDYQYHEKLDAAVRDADEISKILEEKYNFEVTKLINGNYTDIVDAIINFTKNRNFKDNLLIYYAGHGELIEKESRGYWLPINAGAEQDSKWISNQIIKDKIKATKAKHVLLMVDSCFAGALTRGGAGTQSIETLSTKNISRYKMKKTRLVITSGGNEPVVDSDGNEHSYFAAKFIDILKNNEKVIQSLALFQGISRYVINNAQQTPSRTVIHGTGDDGGDFLFFPKG
ncbi:caspase family protein [Pelagibacteraceae bacterium]|nr:caspase family protein [Pelagibacteraceae bacterium]